MSNFRKKPVVIEARQLVDDLRSHTQVANWINANGGTAEVPFAEPCIFILTRGGRMRADIGDWIIKGVQGEFYIASVERRDNESLGVWLDVKR